jgi:hypothetical protein
LVARFRYPWQSWRMKTPNFDSNPRSSGKAAPATDSPSGWPSGELGKIAASDDLHISPLRDDGVTYGTPTWIWSVAVAGNLYVRAYSGRSSRWYQAALRQKAGRITAAGMTREVGFEPIAGAINDEIDAAYREKYRGSPYLNPMIGDRARSATVRITPRPAVQGSRAWEADDEQSRGHVGACGAGVGTRCRPGSFLGERKPAPRSQTIMNYKQLGRTGLKISRLVLGAMNFGEITDEAQASRS